MSTSFDAMLTWDDDRIAFLPEARCRLQRRVDLTARGEPFGLLEPDAGGWVLCIPNGAEAHASVDGCPIDLSELAIEASGERRLRVRAGLHARVKMGEFHFEVRPSSDIDVRIVHNSTVHK